MTLNTTNKTGVNPIRTGVFVEWVGLGGGLFPGLFLCLYQASQEKLLRLINNRTKVFSLTKFFFYFE